MWNGQRSIVKYREVVNDERLILVMNGQGVLSNDVSPTDGQHSVEPRDPVSSRCTERIEPRRKLILEYVGSISATAIVNVIRVYMESLIESLVRSAQGLTDLHLDPKNDTESNIQT